MIACGESFDRAARRRSYFRADSLPVQRSSTSGLSSHSMMAF
jgi:hypothetical protein